MNEHAGEWAAANEAEWDVPLDQDDLDDLAADDWTIDKSVMPDVSLNIILGGLPDEDTSGERVSVNTSFDTEMYNNDIEWVYEFNVKNN